MKKALLFIAVASLLNIANAQCPTTSVVLTTQAQVDAFSTQYPGCTVIPDGIDLEISGTNITSLSALSQLTACQGVLEIRGCPQLRTLNGLNNLTYIGNDSLDGFILRDLPLLNSLTALGNLGRVTGECTVRTCDSLVSLAGLVNLDSVDGSLIIRANAVLERLYGLDSLQYIGETLEIIGNTRLENILALSNLDRIEGGVEGGIVIENNPVLTSLAGLGNDSTTMEGNIDIVLNGTLWLCAVPVLCRYVHTPPPGGVVTIQSNGTGCKDTAEVQASCAMIGLPELQQTQITLLPNPASAYIELRTATPSRIIILDALGRTVDQVNTAGVTQIDIRSLENGVYVARMEHKNGQHAVVKFVKSAQ